MTYNSIRYLEVECRLSGRKLRAKDGDDREGV